jgi:hypothetical protein
MQPNQHRKPMTEFEEEYNRAGQPNTAPPCGIPYGHDPGTGRKDMCVFDVHRAAGTLRVCWG